MRPNLTTFSFNFGDPNEKYPTTNPFMLHSRMFGRPHPSPFSHLIVSLSSSFSQSHQLSLWKFGPFLPSTPQIRSFLTISATLPQSPFFLSFVRRPLYSKTKTLSIPLKFCSVPTKSLSASMASPFLPKSRLRSSFSLANPHYARTTDQLSLNVSNNKPDGGVC